MTAAYDLDVARATASSVSRRSSGQSVRLRRQLVEQLERAGCVTSPAVRSAFLAVPRERFVPEAAKREGLEAVYRDRVILTRRDAHGVYSSSSSQPAIMASMLERLEVRRGQRVLEVGAGTGYNAALLARLVGRQGGVVSVEVEPETARGARRALAAEKTKVKVVEGDGKQGWPRGAPYDRIIVTASAQEVSPAWWQQLVDGGLLEVPLWVDGSDQTQAIVTFEKVAEGLRSVAVLCGGFMPLREAAGARAPEPMPTLSASETVDAKSRLHVHLSGPALKRMSAKRRRQLLALALSEPRVHPLGMRAPRAALVLYLALNAPPDRFVGGWTAPGVISTDAKGFAHLAGRRTFTRIEAYGDPEPQRVLQELIREWRERGRPTERDLRVEVSFDGDEETAVDWSWRS